MSKALTSQITPGVKHTFTFVGTPESSSSGVWLNVVDAQGFVHQLWPYADSITATPVEPAYIPGAMYEDALGDFYYRIYGATPGAAWIAVGETKYRPESMPIRPLRKLVPEPA